MIDAAMKSLEKGKARQGINGNENKKPSTGHFVLLNFREKKYCN